MIKDSNRLQGKTLAEVLAMAGSDADMLKSVYDPDGDGIIAVEQTEATKYPDTGEQAFTDADSDKLDGIEPRATKYPDTGEQAFTDADSDKLDGVETGADVTDATNVAAAGAVMDSDFSGGDGSMRKTGAGAYEVIKSNIGTTAPTVNDDTGDGYAVESRWFNTTANKEYVCLDATLTAAVWVETTGGGGVTDHGALTGLTDDDHTQYLLASGSRAMSGNLNLNYKDIIGVHTLYGHDDEHVLHLQGGASGSHGPYIALVPEDQYTPDPGYISFYATNAAKTGQVCALEIAGVTDTPRLRIMHGLCMSSKKIESLADPAAAQDAATKAWCEANFNNYSHPSARACTSGSWAWASISGKPSTYPPSAHNQSAATITSGTLPVARGGTGVSGDTYDAKYVDGCSPGTGFGDVWKINPYSFAWGGIWYDGNTDVEVLAPGTDGYQLTTGGSNVAPSWAASSDLVFSDTHCPKCGKAFEDGEILVLYLIGHNEIGDILTIPMHQSCANAPKKTVTIKRKVMEDQYTLDELTGEPKVQRVQKMQEKTVTKHKMKEGYVIDKTSGKALKIDKDGNNGKTKYNLSDALETVEETISEVVYEDVEYTL